MKIRAGAGRGGLGPLPRYGGGLRGVEGVLWVAIARHRDPGLSERWCLEYWDDRGEADADRPVADEAEAMRHAGDELGVDQHDWRLGPQPWGHPPAAA